ncbi:ADP-ribosylglycohydrolase (macronuclear) [Tetrahymena thermophila SB210]|uniref:ADP-ribosylglycohydrolase n=1 Tax=Tetrahymena thermophila (strain SB210) TaxID=312017 RepID=Q22TC4_TETTS|nr:ADP-ribosylglycohydrolase [Tetrahymena thermophila SB210]EAR88514.2 ADP-ribosylglycohydrolase [Tetrahymena thermophila SB210]|eukprot:XP_001008759.2 ADP-ribosylglycohydrolase [Tetrahymena thermophila SB210]
MGQNCCSQCNTKVAEQFTLECDEGTDQQQLEAVKAQFKFINTNQIPILLQSQLFKSEFVREINAHQKLNKIAYLQNVKIQSIINDPLGLYLEQQFCFEMNRYQLNVPILSVNLITDWQKMKNIVQQRLQFDRCLLNVMLQEFQGNKFIQPLNDRIFNQFCSIQILQELFVSIDEMLNQSQQNLFPHNQNQNFDKNNKVKQYDQAVANLNIDQLQFSKYANEEFIYIPIINLTFRELSQNAINTQFIDCRNISLTGYSNIEFVLKATQMMQMCISVLKHQQQASPSLNINPSVHKDISNYQIYVLVLHKTQVQIQNMQIIKTRNIEINKYLLCDQQALILKQQIYFQQDQLAFLLSEPVQQQFSSQFLDELLMYKVLNKNTINYVDKYVFNLRKTIFEQLTKIYIQSCKDIQKPQLFEDYLTNSLIYFLKRSQESILQQLNDNISNHQDKNSFSKIVITTKNGNLKPQDIINMSEYADFVFSTCSSIIFDEYFSKFYFQILQDQDNQQIKQTTTTNIFSIIEKIVYSLNKIKQSNKQNNYTIESENFYTEAIQENNKIFSNGQRKETDIQNNNKNNKLSYNGAINQQRDSNFLQNAQNQFKQKLNQLNKSDQYHEPQNFYSPVYQERFVKQNYTPIQETPLTTDQIINSLPISPSNLHEKKEGNFTPKQHFQGQQQQIQHIQQIDNNQNSPLKNKNIFKLNINKKNNFIDSNNYNNINQYLQNRANPDNYKNNASGNNSTINEKINQTANNENNKFIKQNDRKDIIQQQNNHINFRNGNSHIYNSPQKNGINTNQIEKSNDNIILNNPSKKSLDRQNYVNKSNLRYKDDTQRESDVQSLEQNQKVKNVNFNLSNSKVSQNNENNNNNQFQGSLRKLNENNEQESNGGYDSPTFLSSKNINSSFNVFDQQDIQQNIRNSHKKQVNENNVAFQERTSYLHSVNSMHLSKLDLFQKTEIYNKKLDLYLGCIFGSFLGDSMGLFIRYKKQFSIKEIQQSINMEYQPSIILPNPAQLSEISELSLEIGYGLSCKYGVFDQKEIAMNLIEWVNSRPPFNIDNKQFYKVLRQVSNLQDDIKPEELYKQIQQKFLFDQNEDNQVEVLARVCFLAVFTSAVMDEDMIKIIKSLVLMFTHPSDQLLTNACLAICYCIKQIINSNLDRKSIFEKTMKFCLTHIMDSQIIEILQHSTNPIMKVFDHLTIQQQPLQFAVYMAFYFFYHNFGFESSLQNIFSYGGDSCLFGSIVGCLIGAIIGFGNLPQTQLQKMMNFNPENVKFFLRPERYSPKNGYNIAKEILEFYFSKE